jgi:acetyl/propionyl-CoA carboxylase alpha subunit
MHRRLADVAVYVGPARAADSYLDADRIEVYPTGAGETRAEALARLRAALAETEVGAISEIAAAMAFREVQTAHRSEFQTEVLKSRRATDACDESSSGLSAESR